MPRHEPFEYNPPPPSPGATPFQSIFMGSVGGIVTLVTIVGVQRSARSAMELGTFLVALGLLFGIGMVTKSRPVELVTSMLLLFAGGIAIGLGTTFGSWLWYLGAAFFFTCGAVIFMKDRFIARPS
jgi:hypothetical protein